MLAKLVVLLLTFFTGYSYFQRKHGNSLRPSSIFSTKSGELTVLLAAASVFGAE